MPSETRRVHFENLDALRFFAFFSVFLQHSFFTDSQELARSAAFRAIVHIAKHGELGVFFFFVLSGFLITYLLLTEENFRGRIDVPAFYMRRVLRIWPLYFACVLAGFTLPPLIKHLMGIPPEAAPSVWWYVSFLPNFDRIYNGPPDSMLGILWSVGIEEQFYVFWPVLLLFVRRRRVALFAAIIAVSFASRIWWRKDDARIYYHTLAVVSDMAMGGLAAYACFVSEKTRASIARIPGWTIGCVYLTGFAVILLRDHLFVTSFARPLERLVTGSFFAFVIVEQTFGAKAPWHVGRSRLATYWGKYTYGLYCLHFWACNASVVLLKPTGLNSSFAGVVFAQTALSLTLALGIAWLSYELYEKHFLKLKERFAHVTRSDRGKGVVITAPIVRGWRLR